MKAKILVGAIAALIYGNAALAQDQSTTQDQGQQSPDNLGGSGLEDTNNDDLILLDQDDVAPAPVTPDTGLQQDEGVGGSGDVGVQQDQSTPLDEGVGGSGQQSQPGQQSQNLQQPKAGIPMQGQGGVTFFCTPVQEPGATGGSGDLSGLYQPPVQQQPPAEVGAVPITSEEGMGGSGAEAKEKPKEKGDMRGLTVLIGAGVEGYTGGLAPLIDPGAAVGVTAALKPTKRVGLELGYSGAVNDLDVDVAGSGPDIVRNGAQAALTLGLTATPLQPYVLGGFGMNWYNVNNGEGLGFSDDTSSRIPVGVGLRTHLGDFTADARLNYNVLLHEDFAPGIDTGDITTGSYNGTINLGGTF